MSRRSLPNKTKSQAAKGSCSKLGWVHERKDDILTRGQICRNASEALKNGEDQINESHLQCALTRIKQITRPFRVDPFNNENFNLGEELAKEKAAEDRFKIQLLGDKQVVGKKINLIFFEKDEDYNCLSC